MTTARIGRRGLLRGVVAAAAAAAWPRAARAETTVTVALALPGEPALATALEQGAGLGLDDANALATLFGKRLLLERHAVSDAGAAEALGRGRALAVIGGAGAGVSEALRQGGAAGPVLLDVREPADRFRNEQCARRAFHLAPSVSMSVDALARWAVGRQKWSRCALVADGSPRGREIEAAARRALARAGAVVVAGGEAADFRLLAMEDGALAKALAAARADTTSTPLAGLGADVPLGLPAAEAAGFWSVAWHHELERFSARELNSRFRRRFNAPLGETSWAAWAALKLVGEAVVRGGVTDAAGLVTFLESAPAFDGHKGEALTFRKWDHQLRQPLYVIGPRRREEVGGRRGPFAVLADVTTRGGEELGGPGGESRCRFG